MTSQWRVMSQVIGDRRMYIAGRQLDETKPLHGGNVEYAGVYLENREEAVSRVIALNAQPRGGCGGSCLSSIPTRDLVKELATREGVTEYVAGVQDRYLVRTKSDQGISRVDFDLGPATILVVVD